jgi:hypothetical protein
MEPAVMTTITTTRPKNCPTVGERRELGRYTTSDGERRRLVGQRVDGVVRVSDVPVGAGGRAYLIERELEQDGNDALKALVSQYLKDANRHGRTPMGCDYIAAALDLQTE